MARKPVEETLTFKRIHFRMRSWPALLILTASAHAEDVVFAAAKLRVANGSYVRTGPSHLYRIHEEGKGLTQLTFGGDDDAYPCLSADGRSILFWRSDGHGLAGNVRLCAIRPGDPQVTTLGIFSDVPVDWPKDLARGLTSTSRYGLRSTTGKGMPAEFALTDRSTGRVIFDGYGPVSPGGRYMMVDGTTIIDLRSGAKRKLPNDPGYASWLDSRTLALAYLKYSSTLTLSSVDGRWNRTVDVQHGDDWCEIYGWRQLSDGSRSRRLAGNLMLVQQVDESEEVGKPAIYCFNSSSGELRFEIAGSYFEDANAAGTSFLTTGWRRRDGGEPQQNLSICSVRRGRLRALGPRPIQCLGACFLGSKPVRTRKP